MALASDCAPDDIVIDEAPTECTVTATNEGFADAPVDLTTTVDDHLAITDADGDTFDAGSASLETVLAGREPGVPSLEAWGEVGDGYIPAELLGGEPIPVGDEEAVNFTGLPPFVFNGLTYDAFGVTSNGNLIVGGATVEDIVCCPPGQIPSTDRPNNVLAPFWGDLTGEGVGGAPDPDGILAALADFGPSAAYLIVEFRLNAWGTNDLHVFQVWIGLNGEQDITFNYDPENHDLDGLLLAADDPVNGGLTVGAENEPGTGGEQLDTDPLEDTLPPFDLEVVSTDPEPGDSVSLTLEAEGIAPGIGVVHSELEGPTVPGTTIVESEVEVLLPTEEVAAFVGQAFADLLHRQPTPDRLAYWTDRIVHGAPRTELLEGIVNGAEYRGRLVNTTFLDLINRAPTATERNLWTAKLGAGGLSQAELVAFLGGSNAFKTLSGTTGGFVDRLHREILGRNPSPARRAFWVSQINSGYPRSQLAFSMFQSKESRDLRVKALYTDLLHRNPGAGPLSARSATLLTNPDKTVVVALAASDEYYNLAQ